ncbi:MAG TPA: ABC transporter permease [Candidatus Polarisedimenticolia bacterium]|nr:ABC transporter permease [Candidatus Polarisedimenticolia bacterium]
MIHPIQDLKVALRVLAKSPGFTVVTVATLALAIGVNSVIFGLVDAVLFRPLPIREPQSLVRLGMVFDEGMSGNISYPEIGDIREQVGAFSGVAGFTSGNNVYLGMGEESPEPLRASLVGGGFFSLLGVSPAQGRLIDAQDDGAPGGSPVLVLSHALWQKRFGGDPGVIGSTVRMNTQRFTIVGVAPRGFLGLDLEQVPDVWMPLNMLVQAAPNLEQFKPFERRGFAWVDAVARLRPGVSAREAEVQMRTVHARLTRELKLQDHSRPTIAPLAGSLFDRERRGPIRQTSWILAGVTAMVLAIACAVVSGLLLARGERRRREVAVRSALGASRGRIVGHLMTESLVLAAAGCLLGMLFAQWSNDLFLGVVSPGFPLPSAAATPIFTSRVLWFAGGASILCALAFGLLPAWHTSKSNLVEAMRREAAPAGGRQRWLSLGHAFVVAQVALSTVLLIGAGLLLRTLLHASSVDLGFDPRHAWVVSIDVSKSGYGREAGLRFYRDLLDEVRRVPGVKNAAISRHVPVSGGGNATSVELTNFTPPPGQEPRVAFTAVSPGFFRTLGIPMLQGRDFETSDAGGPERLIVNRAFAERFWPGRDALRERVRNFGEGGAEVIGVASDAKQFSIREDPQPMLYVLDASFFMPNTNLVVRTEPSAAGVLPAIRAIVNKMDPKVPLFGIRTLEEHVGIALGEERTIAGLLGAFALLGLALAVIGLYGVVSYSAQSRAREFGIRLALGARPGNLLRTVLGQGAALALTGLVIGLAAGLAASRTLSALLFGVSPTDGATFLGIAGLLLLVATAASALPALRAARLDPSQTLRVE